MSFKQNQSDEFRVNKAPSPGHTQQLTLAYGVSPVVGDACLLQNVMQIDVEIKLNKCFLEYCVKLVELSEYLFNFIVPAGVWS